jgi:hypothetical protein
VRRQDAELVTIVLGDVTFARGRRFQVHPLPLRRRPQQLANQYLGASALRREQIAPLTVLQVLAAGDRFGDDRGMATLPPHVLQCMLDRLVAARSSGVLCLSRAGYESVFAALLCQNDDMATQLEGPHQWRVAVPAFDAQAAQTLVVRAATKSHARAAAKRVLGIRGGLPPHTTVELLARKET